MKAILHSRGLAFDVFENQWPAELNNYSEVLLFGGDGTLNYFVNRYGVLSLPLTLFPGGTGNDVHWKLFGDTNGEKQIHSWPEFKTMAIDVGVCNGEYFVNMVGIGFDGEVLKRMKAIRWIGGHIGYLSVVIRLIFSFVEMSFHNSNTPILYFASGVLQHRKYILHFFCFLCLLLELFVL